MLSTLRKNTYEIFNILNARISIKFFFRMNYVHDRFASQKKEDHAEVVRLCCIIKPLVTWHGEHTASVCRERCGGQGFLAANRFGEAIAGMHAGNFSMI